VGPICDIFCWPFNDAAPFFKERGSSRAYSSQLFHGSNLCLSRQVYETDSGWSFEKGTPLTSTFANLVVQVTLRLQFKFGLPAIGRLETQEEVLAKNP